METHLLLTAIWLEGTFPHYHFPRGLVSHLKAARAPLEEEGTFLLLEEEAEAEQALE